MPCKSPSTCPAPGQHAANPDALRELIGQVITDASGEAMSDSSEGRELHKLVSDQSAPASY